MQRKWSPGDDKRKDIYHDLAGRTWLPYTAKSRAGTKKFLRFSHLEATGEFTGGVSMNWYGEAAGAWVKGK